MRATLRDLALTTGLAPVLHSSHMSERVLVLPRDRVPGGCEFQGLRAGVPAYLDLLAEAIRAAGRFEDRPLAEVSPMLKQLIPYVVVRDGGRIFLMERTDAGGDARVHGKASIGVGGHINPIDGATDPLAAGLRREWDEELVADWEPEFDFVGLLNDDSNPVGSVHLGLVFEVQAAARAISVRERAKLSGRMASLREVRAARDRLETWSQIVLAHLVTGA